MCPCGFASTSRRTLPGPPSCPSRTRGVCQPPCIADTCIRGFAIAENCAMGARIWSTPYKGSRSVWLVRSVDVRGAPFPTCQRIEINEIRKTRRMVLAQDFPSRHRAWSVEQVSACSVAHGVEQRPPRDAYNSGWPKGFGRSQLAAEARSLHRVAPALTRRRAIQGAGDKCSPALEERQSRAWQAPTDAERMAARSP